MSIHGGHVSRHCASLVQGVGEDTAQAAFPAAARAPGRSATRNLLAMPYANFEIPVTPYKVCTVVGMGHNPATGRK